MEFCSGITHHLLNPFTQRNDEQSLTPFQKTIAVVSALAVVFFGGLTPGSIAVSILVLYAFTAYFKSSPTEKTETAAKSKLKYDDDFIKLSSPYSHNRTSTIKIETPQKKQTNIDGTDSDFDFSDGNDSDLDNDSFDSQPLEYKLSNSLDNKEMLKMIQDLPEVERKPHFTNLLNTYFDIDEMPGDGNCCVYALTKATHVNISNRELFEAAKKTRSEIVEFMKEDRNNFEPFCTYVPEERTQLEQQWEKYQKEKDKLKISFIDFIANVIDKTKSELTQALLISEMNEEIKNIQIEFENKPESTDKERKIALETKLSVKYKRNADGEIEVDYDTYLKRMGTNGTWFGSQEITAFARKHHIPVIVYNANNVFVDDQNELHPFAECMYPPEMASSTVQPIYLYHVNGNHYNLLVPKRGVVIPPPRDNKSI